MIIFYSSSHYTINNKYYRERAPELCWGDKRSIEFRGKRFVHHLQELNFLSNSRLIAMDNGV